MPNNKSAASGVRTATVILKQPDEEWQPVEVSVGRSGIDYKVLQRLVGGYIETLNAGSLSVIVNEEGRLKRLPPCVAVMRPHNPPLVLFGPVVVVANALKKNGESIYSGVDPARVTAITGSNVWLSVDRVLAGPAPTWQLLLRVASTDEAIAG